jgi:hypothetical protein
LEEKIIEVINSEINSKIKDKNIGTKLLAEKKE